jgi:serine/threonine protein kinase
MTPERYKQVRDLAGAALDRPEAERRAFLAAACGADEALRAEVSSLLAAADEVRDSPFLENAVALTDGVATGTTSETVEALPPGCRVGPYEILEAIGHGGMGSVYRAVRADETYRQVVAVKVVRRGMETPAAQRRFREERQILAALEHPGIARLLDGGTTEDGLPYLVMEHVPGDPIDAYCDGGRLGVPERLRLFVKVCEAVHHAHRSLVVHRDLKPGNILVTPEGTPKLLDFGIARLLSPPDAATPADHTATSLRAFTPQYASPEQVRGTPVTTSSDVYSLGVVLYELLAGSRPHEGGLAHEMMAAICNVDPDRPSTCVARTKIRTTGSATAEITPEAVSETRGLSPALLRRKLSGDLDTIVLKALRKAPTDRYASVEALADDVRRHLEGRPVQARPQTAGYRAGKFVRRNPGLVAASVLALAALLGGSVVSTRQARIARGERARAEKRFTDVRKLANSLIFELHDSIEDLPGATAARKLIVERALEYLDSLAEEAGEDLSLQRELADAYKRIGDLQGGPYTANLGDTPSALRSYERARSIRQALLASHPGEVSDLVGLAEASRLTADALRASSNPSGALDHVPRRTNACSKS